MVTFLQRFTLFALAFLVLAAPAGAAEVARIDGGSLDARDRGRDFCLRITASGPDSRVASSCSTRRAP